MTGTLSPALKLTVGLAAATALTLAGCSGGTSDSSESASPSSATESSTPTESTSPSAPAGEGGDIQGEWKANSQDLLEANTANLGGVPAATCTGPINMTFKASGKFVNTGTITCGVGGQNITGTITSKGDYTTSDGTLTFSRTNTESTFSFPGGAPSVEFAGNGTADYTITGDTLKLTFTEDPVGTVTQIWHRA